MSSRDSRRRLWAIESRTDEEIQPDGIYQMSGNQISVKTLDLNMPFDEMAAQLDEIAETHFETTRT